MSAILMPAPYTGDGYGLGVMFVGLDDGAVTLEVSLDGETFFTVERSDEEDFCSEAHQFSGLQEGWCYRVYGRITTDGETEDTSVVIPSTTATQSSPARARARSAQTTICGSGGLIRKSTSHIKVVCNGI